ncbi:PREDICTED: 28S ribosomal protein S11, mitochondrial [Diuraphis noxia]|uniref:28S ribosomal protein S11, mitochondrial n=1 Tax=Diuraphis noxia TaxID=143948 RepID=UPI00076384A1|nr:PREDICTED: 28S ribosomal protein S11, mitochondrial [Diuraphis noxia]
MFLRVLRDLCRQATAVPCGQNVNRLIHVAVPLEKNRDRRSFLASVPRKDEGTEGEKFVFIDSSITKKEDMFPDINTPNMLFGGVKFSDVPICHIKSSRNNTILHVTKVNGERIIIRSCGMEGFKNTRKGTNIAAQATAIGLATRALDFGIHTVRVTIRGLGPGRMSSIKGLTMGGLKIISVTDDTPISWNPLRSRKQRKL